MKYLGSTFRDDEERPRLWMHVMFVLEEPKRSQVYNGLYLVLRRRVEIRLSKPLEQQLDD